MSEVLLQRSGNLVEAIPQSGITIDGLYELLRKHLKYDLRIRNEPKVIRATGRKMRTEPRYLCAVQSGPKYSSVVFSDGLISRTKTLLKQCGISWDLNDLRKRKLPLPDMSKLELDKLKDRYDQKKCLASMFAEDMGVIECPTAWGKTFLICQMVRAYPNSNIVISSYRKDVVGSIYERLGEHVKLRDLGRVGGGHKKPRRVTVSTIDSLDYCDVDKCDLFMYDEVHEAASEERMRKIARIRNAKRFGFSASPKGRGDGADLAIEAMFGPVIYVLPYQDAEASGHVATITVHKYAVPGSPISIDNDVARMRFGIWRNELRNQLVSKVAAEHALNGKQVLIIVDKVEHALFIKSQFLPEWPVIHGPVQAEQIKTFKRLGLLPNGPRDLCTPEFRDRARTDFECGRMRFAIATGVWQQGVDMRHLDVLIRADGAVSPIVSTQVPGRLSRGEAGLLVDFDDVFDEKFRHRSDARFRHYKGKGWDIVVK